MSVLDPALFDMVFDSIIKNCPIPRLSDCRNCSSECILLQTNRTRDDLNIIRSDFVEELHSRTLAMYQASRFNDLTSDEFKKILSNRVHFSVNMYNELEALY